MSESSKNISKEDLQQLIKYLKNIDSYQEALIERYRLLEKYVWGFLLLIAGLFDYFMVTVWQNSFLPWLMMYVFGILVVNRLKKELKYIDITFSNKTKKINKFSSYNEELRLVASFLIIFAILFIYGYLNIWYLAFPTVAVIIGFGVFLKNLKVEYSWIWNRLTYIKDEIDKTYAQKSKNKLLVIRALPFTACLISAFVNLIGFFFISDMFLVIQGLVFGSLLGTFIIIEAYSLEKILYNKTLFIGD
jgi:hypothetical protein